MIWTWKHLKTEKKTKWNNEDTLVERRLRGTRWQRGKCL